MRSEAVWLSASLLAHSVPPCCGSVSEVADEKSVVADEESLRCRVGSSSHHGEKSVEVGSSSEEKAAMLANQIGTAHQMVKAKCKRRSRRQFQHV